MKMFRKLIASLALCLVAISAKVVAQTPRDRAVELTALVQESPPTLTLQWNATGFTVTGQTVYRRPKDSLSWAVLATPANAATSYADTTVSAGVSHEYRVSRTISGGPGFAHGYVSAGIRAPLVAERGKVILLVDNTMAAPLVVELTRLANDLMGDGWTVVRQDVSRTATPPGIRAAIQSIYNADPANTVALILFGHIPVPYSGDFAIDGHPNHFGAWPTDVYYGDINGTWTDTFVNDVSSGVPRTANVPGDGKFDQTVIPSDIDLQVGRIDLADMPSFQLMGESTAATETRLLQQYLNRDHNYRHKLAPYNAIVRRGLVDDNFGYAGGEAFAVTAWRSFTACVGAGNVQELDWFGTLQSQNYLWAYGCGPGTPTSAAGIGATTDFVNTDSLAVFNVMFGSFFGDWDMTDVFLRAPLAGRPASLGLVNCWAGRPHWVFHPMALGETVGYCARLTQNNSSSASYDSNFGARFNHIALLGDPTLRLYPVAPPSNAVATPAAQAVTLTWSASTDSPLEGYVISRASSPNGPFTRLRSALVTGTSFVDRSVTPGASYTYLVRAVKDETSPTGTYLNPSQGVFSAAATAGAASGPEIEIGGNGNAITAGDTAATITNGTDFGLVETSAAVVRTFTLANVGAATLTISGVAITGTNASDFAIATAPPGALAPGTSANFQIQFHPGATTARAATVTLTSNDADEGSYSFALAGTGIPPHAEIALYPPSINRSIHSGDSVVETLNVSDPGPGALTYTIVSSLDRYSARDSDSFAGPAFNWIDISATGTEITGWSNLDDAISAPIALGFSFPFYGSVFTDARVCTNGYLSFTDTNTNAGNAPLPAPGGASNMVAPFWCDLLLDGSSHIYTQTTGGNFVVQFQNVGFYGLPNARVTCEAILKPSGEIFFQYQTLTQISLNYTVGIQNAARDDGLSISYNADYAHAGMAIRIRPPGLETWLSLGATSGTIAPGGVQPISATLNASGLALGNYYCELTFNSNALGNAAVMLPVRLTIGNTPVEDWRLLNFSTTANSGNAADTADVDHDGRSNLLEYALGTNPLAFEVNAPPATAVNTGGYLQIQFPRDATRTDLRYFVEATSNLTAAWTTIASSIHGAPVVASGAHSSTETGSGNVKTVTVEDTAPVATFTSRYLRVRVPRD